MIDLIVGGTDGLGQEIARDFAEAGADVVVAGRHDPQVDFAEFRRLDLTEPDLPRRLGAFVNSLPEVRTLVYSPAFYQDGRLPELSDDEVDDMLNVCGRGLIFTVKKIMEHQGELPGLIEISSTSQSNAKPGELAYGFAKAGAKNFSQGLAKDSAVGRVLVAAPAAMATGLLPLHRHTPGMLDPAWAADQIGLLWTGRFGEVEQLTSDMSLDPNYRYLAALILREPPRVKIEETFSADAVAAAPAAPKLAIPA